MYWNPSEVECRFKDLLRYKAELFEKMASERSENLVRIQFIETALRLYQGLGDSAKIKELETAYTETRAKIEMKHYVSIPMNMFNDGLT